MGAEKPAESSYEPESDSGYDTLYYKTPKDETKIMATEKPTPGPTYYKPIDDSYVIDPYQQSRTVVQDEVVESPPIPYDFDPANEFGVKAPSSNQEEEEEKKTYKSSFKIVEKPSERRYDTGYERTNPLKRRYDTGYKRTRHSERRYDTGDELIEGLHDTIEDSNYDFKSNGFLDDSHFATDIWDMFDNADWGQKIQ